MQKSIVTRYFVICAAVVMASVICIGSVLLVLATQFYKAEKKEALLANINDVIYATKPYYLTHAPLDTDYLTTVYKRYSLSSGSGFALIDEKGKAIVCSGNDEGIHFKKNIDTSILNGINDEYYFSIGTMNNYYDKSYFNLIVPFDTDTGKKYVVSFYSAENLNNFISSMTNMFIICVIVVFSIVSLILYFSTRRLMKPLKEMTEAAKKFGRGDFSQKLDIQYDDEMGSLAASLNDMAYSLSVLENTRKSFIANVSHELKTPMTTIGGFVDGILDGTIPKEKERHYLKTVSQEVNRLSRLVRSMLNIAKYETGEIEMTKISFDITALTIKTVLLFESNINNKKLDIIGLDTEPLLVNADVDLIQQILYNLIENAVKFSDEGGYISFKFSKDDEKASVSIRNSGEGLTQDELPRVFDRFYKTDESHGKDKTGVGLGLSIVRSIINLHEGTILVRSKKNKYTEFTFTLPF